MRPPTGCNTDHALVLGAAAKRAASRRLASPLKPEAG
jgi:hypothetical protein